MTEKDKILNLSLETFLKEGFYKTTMDEIAAKLHMSKKTIYKNFSTKEELLAQVTQFFLKSNHKAIRKSFNSDSNAVEKIYYMTNTIGTIVSNISDRMLSDLQSYAPELWKRIDEFRTRVLTVNFTKIIEQGKAEGFVNDINSILVITAFVSSIRGVANPQFVTSNKITLIEALETTISIFLNGVLTEKGKKNLIKLKNNGAK